MNASLMVACTLLPDQQVNATHKHVNIVIEHSKNSGLGFSIPNNGSFAQLCRAHINSGVQLG